MPRTIEKIKIAGRKNQQNNINKPIIKTIISITKPKEIKTNLRENPITLEKILETMTSAYFLKLNPLP